MNQELVRLISRLDIDSRLGASDKLINDLEERLGTKFPMDYIELMTISNGFTGFVGENSYLIVWQIEQIEFSNQQLNMAKYAPGLLAFGGNGGGTLYAFDLRASFISIVDLPIIGAGPEDAIFCGHTFTEFLQYLYNY